MGHALGYATHDDLVKNMLYGTFNRWIDKQTDRDYLSSCMSQDYHFRFTMTHVIISLWVPQHLTVPSVGLQKRCKLFESRQADPWQQTMISVLLVSVWQIPSCVSVNKWSYNGATEDSKDSMEMYFSWNPHKVSPRY